METTTDIADFRRETLDELEAVIASCPQIELPVVHRFLPGLYVREITIPAGSVLTSMEHLTEHPFFIARGKIKVSSANEGNVTYEGPHWGITKPHTRRALLAITETVWTTFHATELTDVEAIGEAILAAPSNPLMPADYDHGWKRSLPERTLTAK